MNNIVKIYEKHKLYSITNENEQKKIQDVDNLGSPDNDIWIFVSSSNKEENNTLLQKIMSSVNVPLETVFMVYIEGEIDNMTSYVLSYHPKKIFVFGLNPNQLKFQINHIPYQRFQYLNAEWLFVDSLEELEQNRTLKARLWNAMKAWFSIEAK